MSSDKKIKKDKEIFLELEAQIKGEPWLSILTSVPASIIVGWQGSAAVCSCCFRAVLW